jgi:hypothetical protein
MKINKFTSALIALGVVSVGSLAQANTTIYLTGSTAARAVIYAAATTAGQIFTAGATTIYGANNNGNNTICYEGNISGVGIVDLDCSFTGSEAGIASVAGQTLTQNVNGGTYALPGVPPSFLNPNNTFATTNTLQQITGSSTVYPDLSMADTSQAVSQTPKSLYNLVDYGVVGIIPFTFEKGYEASPDTAWSHFHNVTTAAFNQNLSSGDIYNANNYTGVAADASDGVAIVGRNLGSGTRVNTLLNAQYGITTPVKQQAFYSSYPSGTPGVLTFNGTYTSPGNGVAPTSYGNDGFDGGSSVQKELNVDGSVCGDVVIGYLGVSDAQNAVNPAKAGNGQVATALTFNGVYESDIGVINGTYTFWGQEHLLGQVNQSSTSPAGYTAAAIVSGIAAQLTSSHAGTATGDFSTSPLTQSVVIPTSLMQVHRSTDVGFPAQGNH